MQHLSIIIPVLNEEKLIQKNTIKLISFLNSKNLDYEIFLCNNGSKDNTLNLAKDLKKKHDQVRVIHNTKRGVGRVFKEAVKKSKYNNIVSVDMDLSIDLEFIPKSLELLKEYDLIIGSKKMGSQKRSIIRKLPSTIFILLVRFLLHLPYNDYSLAAKAYKKEVILDNLGIIDDGTSYVINLIYLAKKNKRGIIEIPVKCVDNRESKFNLFEESWYRFKKLLALYKKTKNL